MAADAHPGDRIYCIVAAAAALDLRELGEHFETRSIKGLYANPERADFRVPLRRFGRAKPRFEAGGPAREILCGSASQVSTLLGNCRRVMKISRCLAE